MLPRPATCHIQGQQDSDVGSDIGVASRPTYFGFVMVLAELVTRGGAIAVCHRMTLTWYVPPTRSED